MKTKASPKKIVDLKYLLIHRKIVDAHRNFVDVHNRNKQMQIPYLVLISYDVFQHIFGMETFQLFSCKLFQDIICDLQVSKLQCLAMGLETS